LVAEDIYAAAFHRVAPLTATDDREDSALQPSRPTKRTSSHRRPNASIAGPTADSSIGGVPGGIRGDDGQPGCVKVVSRVLNHIGKVTLIALTVLGETSPTG
jgi:hypothetical protein